MFIEKNGVCLRPVGPSDHQALLSWAYDPLAHHALARRATRFSLTSAAGDPEELIRGTSVLMIDVGELHSSGYAIVSGASPISKQAFVDIFMDEVPDGSHLMEVWRLFVDLTFSWMPLNGVRREIVDMDTAVEVPMAKAMGFIEEGVLTDGLWIGNEYRQIIHMYLARSSWEQSRSRFIDNIRIQVDYDQLS